MAAKVKNDKVEANNETSIAAGDAAHRQLVPVAQQSPINIAAVACSWANIRTMDDAFKVAELIGKSGAYPKIKNAGQALAIMLTGAEMGFGVAASLAGIHIIEGPVVGANLKAAAIRSSGRYDYDILTEAGSERLHSAVAFFSLRDGKRHHLGTIVEELSKVPPTLLKKPNWINHPDDMLFATAINKGFRRYTPDLTGGVLSYDEDEMDSDSRSVSIASTGPVKVEMPATLKMGEVIDASYTIKEPGKAPVHVSMEPPARLYASDEQVTQLCQLELKLGVTQDQHEAFLFYFAKLRGVGQNKTYRDLHPDDAACLIRRLEKELTKKTAPKPPVHPLMASDG